MLRRFGECDRYRQLLMFIGIDRIELTQRAIRVELATEPIRGCGGRDPDGAMSLIGS